MYTKIDLFHQQPRKFDGVWCLIWCSDQASGDTNQRFVGAFGDTFLLKLEYEAIGSHVYVNMLQDWEQSKDLADEMEKLKQLVMEGSEIEEVNNEAGNNGFLQSLENEGL